MSEYTKELCDVLTGRKSLNEEALIEELADVMFVAQSMYHLYPASVRKKIAERIKYKTEKRRKKINGV